MQFSLTNTTNTIQKNQGGKDKASESIRYTESYQNQMNQSNPTTTRNHISPTIPTAPKKKKKKNLHKFRKLNQKGHPQEWKVHNYRLRK